MKSKEGPEELAEAVMTELGERTFHLSRADYIEFCGTLAESLKTAADASRADDEREMEESDEDEA